MENFTIIQILYNPPFYFTYPFGEIGKHADTTSDILEYSTVIIETRHINKHWLIAVASKPGLGYSIVKVVL